MKKHKILIFISWISVILWMLLIFSFSAQNAEQSSSTSGGLAEYLAKLIYHNFDQSQDILIDKCQFIVRKTAHFTVYAVLGILSYTAVRISKFKFPNLIASIICLTYAASDEIHQYFVPGRSCELRDICIDFTGSVAGITAITVIILIIKKIKKKKYKKNS